VANVGGVDLPIGVRVRDPKAAKFLARDIRELNKAYDAGSISAKRYALSQKEIEASARRLIGTTKIEGAAFRNLNATMIATPVAARKARAGLGTIRSSGASLAARMVGLNGTVGTLFSGIAQFAVGNLVAIGIIAGISGHNV